MRRGTRGGIVVAAGVAGIMMFGAVTAEAACKLCATIVGTAEGTLIEPNPLERQLRVFWDPVAGTVITVGDAATDAGERSIEDATSTADRISDRLLHGDLGELVDELIQQPGEQAPPTVRLPDPIGLLGGGPPA